MTWILGRPGSCCWSKSVVKAPGDKKVSPGHGWMYYARGAAQIAFFVAVFKVDRW